MVGGGFVVGAAFALAGGAESFALIVAAMTLSASASGAFVSLSQAVMIGTHPARENEMMARWTAAGTLGDLFAPAVLAAVIALGASWRDGLILLGAVGVALASLLRSRLEFPPLDGRLSAKSIRREVRRNLNEALRLPDLRRWLMLLPLSDLMLDVFFGYLAIFLVDVDGMPPATAAISLSLWIWDSGRPASSGTSTAGKTAEAGPSFGGGHLARLRPLWLSTTALPLRIGLLPALGLLASPWYPVLQGQAYAALPERPATVAAMASLIGSLGGLLAVVVGVVAGRAGLVGGMTLLALGPLALVLFFTEVFAVGQKRAHRFLAGHVRCAPTRTGRGLSGTIPAALRSPRSWQALGAPFHRRTRGKSMVGPWRVLISDGLAQVGVSRLRQEAEVILGDLGSLGSVDAWIVRSRTRVDAAALASAAPRLRVLGRPGVGVDNIDLEAARREKVIVVTAPEATTIAVAELTLGLMLALARHIPAGDAALRRGEWVKAQLEGTELNGKTLGLVGIAESGGRRAARSCARNDGDRLRSAPGPGGDTNGWCDAGRARCAADRLRLRQPSSPADG
jgi:hypothetical protein